MYFKLCIYKLFTSFIYVPIIKIAAAREILKPLYSFNIIRFGYN